MPPEAAYEVVNQPFSFGVTRNVFEGGVMAIVLYGSVELRNHIWSVSPKYLWTDLTSKL
jgi:hypothetical protein